MTLEYFKELLGEFCVLKGIERGYFGQEHVKAVHAALIKARVKDEEIEKALELAGQKVWRGKDLYGAIMEGVKSVRVDKDMAGAVSPAAGPIDKELPTIWLVFSRVVDWHIKNAENYMAEFKAWLDKWWYPYENSKGMLIKSMAKFLSEVGYIELSAGRKQELANQPF